MPDVMADLPAPVRDVLQVIPVQRLEEVSLSMSPDLGLLHTPILCKARWLRER